MKNIFICLALISTGVLGQVKIPGRVQAESCSSYSKPLPALMDDTTTAGSGGKLLKYGKDAWSSYLIATTVAGNYLFTFRVGDGSGGAVMQVRNSSGFILGSFKTPATGNLKTWGYATAIIPLPAGKQTIRLVDSIGEFNIDWFDISAIAAPVIPITVPSMDDFLKLKRTTDSLLYALTNYRAAFDSLKTAFDSSFILLDARDFRWENGKLRTNKADTAIKVNLIKSSAESTPKGYWKEVYAMDTSLQYVPLSIEMTNTTIPKTIKKRKTVLYKKD